MEINEIRPQYKNYLSPLETIALTPKILYYYGKWPQSRDDLKTVAIVGARKCTHYGEEIAYKLAKNLAEKGVIVISGLAYGIDSIAAKGALDGGGKTIAILGTEIEKIHPSAHVPLAEKIVEQGGIVASEYKLGDSMDYRYTFLHRNRLISALADAVVVVEAREKSGSLNTASHALTQGKDVFAVPGDISRLTSQGCNRLISTGATPYLSVEDFLKYLFPVPQKKKGPASSQLSLFASNEEERKILELLEQEIRDGEEIMAKLNMDASVFNQSITMLEIKGVVKSLGMNCWMLN
ncbi:DNA-processing protein DprA [Candidatus Saccharibacteria bacterium]|nr:DNA-processing protein DprA [Candidatus Saccharibacteria bacterium]